MLSPENLARLKPGYKDFHKTLTKLGCIKCHSTDSKVPDKLSPHAHGVYVLNPSDYFKTKNIGALALLIDLDDLKNSELLLRASGEVEHVGTEGKEFKLKKSEVDELRHSRKKWVYSFIDEKGY